MDNLRRPLTHSKYTRWAIDRVGRRLSKPTNEDSNVADTQGTDGVKPTTNEVEKPKGHIDIPYTRGLCKSIKKIYIKYGIHTYFKGSSTIKNLVVPPRIKTQ